jgi:cell division septation protein DedD
MSPVPGEREIWLTRGQLLAIFVLACCIAVLTFFLGLVVGRSERIETPEVTTASPLVRPSERVEALDALLARVEAHASAATPEGVLSYPSTLPSGDLTSGALVESGFTSAPSVLTPGRHAAQPPEAEATRGVVPSSGWAIEVLATENVGEADKLVDDLLSRKTPAYRLATVVDGRSLHRVRVGPYASREAAEGARSQVGQAAGVDRAIVIEAP